MNERVSIVPIRLVVAVLLSGVIGLERGLKNRAAGFRTFMLVCIGSCVVMMTNQYLFQLTGSGDPVRMGAQVISGVGFLGAGCILLKKGNSRVTGLTTAAGLWATGSIGLAIGIGFYIAALLAFLIVFLTITLFIHLEKKANRSYYKDTKKE